MKLSELTTTLINNVSYVSWAVIGIIIALFITAIILNVSITVKYKKLLSDLREVNFEGMEIYKNKIINLIVSKYKETYKKSNDSVNTQAIIESGFYSNQKSLFMKEKFLNNVVSMMVTVGLVGTIYCLVVVSADIAQIFKEVPDVPSLQSVLGDISTVVSYLAIAFVTTFISILTSFIYTIINSVSNIEILRGNVFSRLEDYLDNELAATLSETMKKSQNLSSTTLNPSLGNSNILYMIENTSNSMMQSTLKLESTIAQLNENIKGMVVTAANNNDVDMLSVKEEAVVKPEKFKKNHEDRKSLFSSKKNATNSEKIKFEDDLVGVSNSLRENKNFIKIEDNADKTQEENKISLDADVKLDRDEDKVSEIGLNDDNKNDDSINVKKEDVSASKEDEFDKLRRELLEKQELDKKMNEINNKQN